jgi:carbonic anhydrase
VQGAIVTLISDKKGATMRHITARQGLLGVALVLAASAAFAAEGGHHWSYSGETNPAHWGSMEKEFATCGIGKAQSPIDIHTSKVHIADLPAIAFDYKPAALRIIDNGHTVQVNYPPGSTITVGDKRYELVQFHFHKPSEEKINGKRFDMVAHLVHKDVEGHLAVVAVPLKAGLENALVATLWKNLPKKKEQEVVVDSVSIDATNLLPANRGYYTFEGSLTTPPCSEGVRWFVLRGHTTISKSEITAFGKLYPMNARPVQPLNGREVMATK